MQVKQTSLLPSLALDFADPLVGVYQALWDEGLADADDWLISWSADQNMWLSFRCKQGSLPAQGWKLHVSADLTSAETIWRRVLPLLLRETLAFKVTSSLAHLKTLNSAGAGESQIGKFLTIYPRDDTEAVALATRLDEATHGLSGPRIPSDRMLKPGSLVFYRYGAFASGAYIQDLLGQVWPAMKRLEDELLVPDKRLTHYQAPDPRSDPFLTAGVAEALPKETRLLAGRYLLLSEISTTVNHTVSMAVDMELQRTCVLKSSGRLWQPRLPASMRESFRREAAALRALAGYPRFPSCYDLLEQEENVFLVLSDVPGQLLKERLNQVYATDLLTYQQALLWARDLAEMLEFVHSKQLVYADLKPTNVIIGPDEQLYLIDFEATDVVGQVSGGQGTRGYMSPQRFAAAPLTFADDIYSFGSLLYLLLTGVEASLAPDPFALLERSVRDLRPDIPSALASILTRCLQPQPQARYASMRELRNALLALDLDKLPLQATASVFQPVEDEESTTRFRRLAEELLHTLCATAHLSPAHRAPVWKTTHPMANNVALRDLNAGQAGPVLALAGLLTELDEPGAHEVLAHGARTLLASVPHSASPLPGLYVGEAGVGAALLLAGQTLADPALLAAAAARGRLIATLPQVALDVMHGTAGRLLFHLLLWEATGDQEHLDAAQACGAHLLHAAQERLPGEWCWSSPPAFQTYFGSRAYVGYAHGAAGIADTLLDLFEATGEERLVPLLQGVTRWLVRQALPVLSAQRGLGWPSLEDQKLPALPLWCHGAVGVGRFFLHASRHAWLPGTLAVARKAAEATITLGRAEGSTLCHGLAGGVEFLLDMYLATGERRYLLEAQTSGRLLAAFATVQHDLLFLPSDQMGVFSPDYQIGYAGAAISFLRLSVPGIPYQLSRAGFRAYQQRAEARRTALS